MGGFAYSSLTSISLPKFRSSWGRWLSVVLAMTTKAKINAGYATMDFNYLTSTFIIDFLAALPLPQAFIWQQSVASESSAMSSFNAYFVLFITYCFDLFETRNNRNRGNPHEEWHVRSLLQSPLAHELQDLLVLDGVEPLVFEWDQLLSNCTKSKDFEIGLFSAAFENKIGTRSFIQKYMFCFSWGLKSVSSLGQNFTTSFSTADTVLSIFITLAGLILFADLVTRMQAGIQSMEEREEQQRSRQREIKEWMHYHQLPPGLKERVDLAIQSEWTENGIDDEAMLDSLPMDLRSEIRKYLYMELLSKLPKFEDMDAELVQAVCQHLRTFSSREGTYIIYEGDTVNQMLFIFSGELELSFTDRGNSSVTVLGPGECCGQELVTWASQPATSMDNLPSSTWTIKCLTDVEAFVLQAYDMKILATQFAHNQEFQRAFKQHYP